MTKYVIIFLSLIFSFSAFSQNMRQADNSVVQFKITDPLDGENFCQNLETLIERIKEKTNRPGLIEINSCVYEATTTRALWWNSYASTVSLRLNYALCRGDIFHQVVKINYQRAGKLHKQAFSSEEINLIYGKLGFKKFAKNYQHSPDHSWRQVIGIPRCSLISE